jgi:hypothetical protein
MIIYLEERKGKFQKIIQFISEILIKFFGWLQPRRQ